MAPAERQPLGDAAARRHDFGAVVGRPGLRLVHPYRLANAAAKPIRVLQAVNMKTCCGDLRIGPTTIEPGGSTTLEVTLRVGASLGPLSHYAVVETDHPEAARLEFWTTADVHPRARIEEGAADAAPLFPGATARRGFVAYTYGTPAEPPAALDDGALKSDLDVAWDGPAGERTTEAGLIERSRPFAVVLLGAAEPGRRAGQVDLVAGDATLLQQPLQWEVAAAVEPTPSGLIVPAAGGRRAQKVALRARDGRAFRVASAEADLPGVEVRPAGDESKLAHVLDLTIEPGPRNAGRAGELAIATDHPAQPLVKVALFISGSAPAEGGTP